MNNYFYIKMENEKIPIINYLKGFSIITIVLMHLIQMFITTVPNIINTLSSIGGTGVHVFFMCSGIGLYLSYLKNKTTFTNFLKKRFLKIYIPYIIVVIISFFVPFMYHNNDRLYALTSHIFLFKMFVPNYEESFGVHFWFISTLIQLYLLFIPMCKVKEKISNKLFVTLFLSISILWWIIVYVCGLYNFRIWNSFCFQYIWEFAFGMVIAQQFADGRTIKIKNYILLICTFLGLFIQFFMSTILGGGVKQFNDIPALIGYTSLSLLLYNLSFVKSICSKVSDISYELYLLHILVFSIMFNLIGPSGIIMQLIVGSVSIIISVCLASLYNLFIRKYILKKA